MTDSDFADLMQWMSDKGAGRADLNLLYTGMLQGLANGDHPERMALIEPLIQNKAILNYGDLGKAAAKWAEKDMDGLLAYINDGSDGPARDAAIAGVCSQLARTDARRALDFLAGLETFPEGVNATQLIRNAMDQGHGFVEILRELPESLRTDTLNSLPYHLSTSGSVSEFLGAVDLITDEKRRDATNVMLAGFWAREDPRAAAAWVGEMPVSETRALAAENLARFWAMTDPAAAARWALSLDDPASRSRAVHGAADYLANVEPQRALELATEVTDAELRVTVQTNALQNLARQNPDLAGKLLEATAMSDANRRTALQHIDEMRALHAYLETVN